MKFTMSPFGEVMKRGSNGRKVLDKPPIIGCQSKESTNFTTKGGRRKVAHSFRLLRLWLRSSSGHNMAKELHLRLSELAFVLFQLQVCGANPIKNLLQNAMVFLPCIGENNDVIEEHKTSFYSVQDLAHHTLEGSGDVGQTKRHDGKLVVIYPDRKCCFSSIRFRQRNLPIAIREIHSTETAGATELVKDVVNAWHWVSMFLSDRVHSSKIDAKLIISIFLKF